MPIVFIYFKISLISGGQVVYYATDTLSSRQLYINVWDVIEYLEERGFQVDCVMMHGGSADRAFVSMLGENPRIKRLFMPNILDFSRSICLVQDIPVLK